MDTDMSRSVVLFQVAAAEHPLVADAPAREDDFLRQAWAEVSRENPVDPAAVTLIHSEWQFSPADEHFATTTFPNLGEVHFNFQRPGPQGWEEAMAQARAVVQEFHENQLREEAAKSEERVLLPVLRSGGTETSLAQPFWDLVPGKLFATLARVGPTPHGTIGMDHVVPSQISDEAEFDRLAREALGNLTQDLRIGSTAAPGEPGGMLELSHPSGFVTSLVVEPNFHARMSEIVGTQRLVVAMPCADVMYVADADSEWRARFEEMVLASTHDPYPLAPTLLLIDATGPQVLTQKTA
ncbi:hypothetical protein GCM10022247_37500 [Allokutzneria multivorans]|uniref:Uncharacterized protein n=1 Tax=Allokutzneria multivorans TaxID=1142134 RepID=A0ABP7SGT1_9PSEU